MDIKKVTKLPQRHAKLSQMWINKISTERHEMTWNYTDTQNNTKRPLIDATVMGTKYLQRPQGDPEYNKYSQKDNKKTQNDVKEMISNREERHNYYKDKKKLHKVIPKSWETATVGTKHLPRDKKTTTETQRDATKMTTNTQMFPQRDRKKGQKYLTQNDHRETKQQQRGRKWLHKTVKLHNLSSKRRKININKDKMTFNNNRDTQIDTQRAQREPQKVCSGSSTKPFGVTLHCTFCLLSLSWTGRQGCVWFYTQTKRTDCPHENSSVVRCYNRERCSHALSAAAGFLLHTEVLSSVLWNQNHQRHQHWPSCPTDTASCRFYNNFCNMGLFSLLL